jgi:FAD/FMN-containing dehydrogenase
MTEDLIQALTAIVGANGVIADAPGMEGFCTDWFGRFRGTARAVVLPRSTAEVSGVLACCTRLGVPVVPQGGNTSVCGGSVPDGGPARAIVLSLSRMNAVRHVDTLGNAIVVEAGCVLARVQQAAEEAGRLFPLSLSAEGSCQIGGTISTNAGGTAVLRYGTMRELVLGLEVVLPDGRVWDGLRTIRKDSSGYDLKGVWIGAEGTLGIITAAALKLFPQLRERAVAWVALNDPDAALALLAKLRERFDTRLTAFELMSRSQVQLVYDHVERTRSPLAGDHPWHLLLELAETSVTGTLSAALEEALGGAMEKGLAQDAILARSGQQAVDLWHIRHAITDALKAAGASLTHDVAVPLSAVPDYIRRAEQVIASRFPEALATVVCHMGDGNVHYNLTFPRALWSTLSDPEALASQVSDAVQDIAVELGGTFVAEHGIGRKFRKAAGRYKGNVERDIVHGLKRLLDPTGIMNPGRTLPP